MSANHKVLGSRHPKVMLIHDNEEDTVGAATIIREQVEEFKSIHYDSQTPKLIYEHKPAVLLFAFKNVNESIEIYSELVADQTISYPHQSILLCSNKESGIAFRTCIKGLFDNYFVYQPLYERFRLKMIVHGALISNSLESNYGGFAEEQLEYIDDELAELIEQGSACKQYLLESISHCKENLEEVLKSSPAERQNVPVKDLSQQDMLKAITINHVEPMLDDLEKEIKESLGQLLNNLLNRHEANNESLEKVKQSRPLSNKQKISTSVVDKSRKNDVSGQKKSNAIQSDLNITPDSTEVCILVVEDNELYRDMLISVLSKEKYHVDYANDGLEALKKVKSNHYDCVLMDLHMPKLDGLNATKQLKKMRAGKEIPVIALTGNKRKDLVKQWATCGLKGYIMKPSTKEEILGTVSKVLN